MWGSVQDRGIFISAQPSSKGEVLSRDQHGLSSIESRRRTRLLRNATLAIQDINSLCSELLGHSSVTVTMRYTHSNLASKMVAVGKLGATATIQLHPAPKRSSSNPKCSKLAANL